MDIEEHRYQYSGEGADFKKYKHNICGCFYCLQIFPSSQIKEYTDEGHSAICPKCSIDSVVGDCQKELPSKKLFKKWYDESFLDVDE